MKLAAACMLMCLALGTDTTSVSFRSKHIGKLDPVSTKTEEVVTEVSTAEALPWRPVSFSSARKIGGNYQGESDRDPNAEVSFKSARRIGNLGDNGGAFTEAMTTAREAHKGVSFRSRNMGLYLDPADDTDESDVWTRISDAIDEEDWAVMTATLATFFATCVIAILIGICCGVCCCARLCMMRVMGAAAAAQGAQMASMSPGPSNKGNDGPDTERGLK